MTEGNTSRITAVLTANTFEKRYEDLESENMTRKNSNQKEHIINEIKTEIHVFLDSAGRIDTNLHQDSYTSLLGDINANESKK